MRSDPSGRLLWLAFERAAASHADAKAVVDGATSISYAQLLARATEHATRLRTTFADLALDGPDDRPVVALLAVDPLKTLSWLFAALSTGASVVPVAPNGPDRRAQLRLLRPDVIVTCEGDAMIDLDDRGSVDGAGDGGPVGDHRFPPGILPPGLIVCTAGTTGAPKAVVHSHVTLGHAIRRLQLFRLEAAGTPAEVAADDEALAEDLFAAAAAPAIGLRYATTLPFTTMAGLTVAFQALLSGESLALVPGWDAGALLETIATSGVTNVSLTPLLAQLVLRVAKPRLPQPTNLLFVGIGGGPVVPTLPAELESVIGCPVAVGYGTTEAGGAITMGRLSDAPDLRHGTVGRALPGVDLWVDPITHELAVRCASTAIGYVTQTSALTTLDRAACPTGDLARVRPDGAIELFGRSDALILRGGRNIDPVRIERALEEHPAVRRAAAFGMSNPVVSGEQDIWTVVVLDNEVDESELRSHCSQTLGASLTPRRVIAVDALPLTADGAVRRHDLADLAGHRTARARTS